jgi:hypothetical protein
MQWFKHKGTFRNSPAMRYVAEVAGDRGVAAAYRLYEVMTERFGVDDDYSGSLMLSRPLTLRWLGREITTKPFDEDNAYYYDPTAVEDADVLKLLATFHDAGLILLTSKVTPTVRTGEDGVEVGDKPERFYTITVPGFATDCADEYTARRRAKGMTKGLNTPE